MQRLAGEIDETLGDFEGSAIEAYIARDKFDSDVWIREQLIASKVIIELAANAVDAVLPG